MAPPLDAPLLKSLAGALAVTKQGNLDSLRAWAEGVGYEACVQHLKNHMDDVDNPYAVCHFLVGKSAPPGPVWKKIERRGDQYCVTTEDGSRTLGCHDTMEAAQRQLAAVEANKRGGVSAFVVRFLAKLGLADAAAKMEHEAVTFDEALARRRLSQASFVFGDLVGALWEAVETAVLDPEAETSPAIRDAVEAFADRAAGDLVAALASDVGKAHRISAARLARLRKLRTLLGDLLREAAGAAGLDLETAKRLVPGIVICKADAEQRIAFGWANVSATSEGKPVVQEGIDGYKDVIPPDVLERAAYGHVLDYREAGANHQGGTVGRLVESWVPTADKLEKMGLDPESIPASAWWVGYRIDDDAVWDEIKAGLNGG